MPTIDINVTKEWQAITQVPETVSISAIERKVIFRISENTPTEKSPGHTLKPGEGNTITLTGVDRLYVRAQTPCEMVLTR